MVTAILGGGLSGLSAAYYMLRRFGQPSTIFESSNRIGGWIKSETHKDRITNAEFIFEAGPRTIRPKGLAGANTLELIEELDLPIEAIPATHAAARNRMIYANNELCLLPNSLTGLLTTKPPFTKPLFRAVIHDIFAGEKKKFKFGDESIYSFAKRRFGQDIADYAISPMICGICAGDAKEISVRFLMNDLFDKEQRYGGVLKGILFDSFRRKKNNKSHGIFTERHSKLYTQAVKEKWSMYNTVNGMETLPRKLGDHLKERGVDIMLTNECHEIIFLDGLARMNIQGRYIKTPHVISTIPSYKLATCVKDQHPSLAENLLLIPYVDVAVVNLRYSDDRILKHNAFGFLVPPKERLPILGVIFDTCCFNMDDSTVLTVMMGGRWFEEYFGKNPTQKDLLDTALKHVNKILDINEEPKTNRVRILEKCIPQYTVGHQRRISDIRNYIKHYKLPLSLCGAAYDGVGINDVILSARQQVYQLPTMPA